MKMAICILCLFLCISFHYGCSDRIGSGEATIPENSTISTDYDVNHIITLPDQHGDGSMIVTYEIPPASFHEFLHNPDREYLDSLGGKYIYSLCASDPAIIERRNSEGSEILDAYPEGVYRLSYTPMYASLIESWGSKDWVSAVLSMNGIDGEPEHIVFVYTDVLPACIWISTKENDYFVSVNEYSADYADNTHGESYTYRFYQREEYAQKMEQ